MPLQRGVQDYAPAWEQKPDAQGRLQVRGLSGTFHGHGGHHPGRFTFADQQMAYGVLHPIQIGPGSKSPTRKGVYKCAACREHFTVTVGTILEDSHLPISKWLMAFFILCASKKSMSAHQLHQIGRTSGR